MTLGFIGMTTRQSSFDFDAAPHGQSDGYDPASVTAEGGNWREEVEPQGSDRRCRPLVVVAVPLWREVPQPLFLSWPPAMQSAYCARRDEDAAQREDNLYWKTFYQQRAASYRAGACHG